MPKFRVKISQYVQEIAEIEIDAENEDAAKKEAITNYPEYDPDWQDGYDSEFGHVIEILPG